MGDVYQPFPVGRRVALSPPVIEPQPVPRESWNAGAEYDSRGRIEVEVETYVGIAVSGDADAIAEIRSAMINGLPV